MENKIITILPTDAEVEQWFADNIGIENDCSASSAIFKFRQLLKDKATKNLCPKCNWHIIEQDEKGSLECYWCGELEDFCTHPDSELGLSDVLNINGTPCIKCYTCGNENVHNEPLLKLPTEDNISTAVSVGKKLKEDEAEQRTDAAFCQCNVK